MRKWLDLNIFYYVGLNGYRSKFHAGEAADTAIRNKGQKTLAIPALGGDIAAGWCNAQCWHDGGARGDSAAAATSTARSDTFLDLLVL